MSSTGTMVSGVRSGANVELQAGEAVIPELASRLKVSFSNISMVT